MSTLLKVKKKEEWQSLHLMRKHWVWEIMEVTINSKTLESIQKIDIVGMKEIMEKGRVTGGLSCVCRSGNLLVVAKVVLMEGNGL